MDSPLGKLIVLEGSDGAGKTTQFKLLAERLKAAGYDVAVFDFPRYDHESSYFIKQYLAGRYGPAGELSPYTSAMFYALDRFEAAGQIKQALAAGKIVLMDRYVGANMAYQGSKFDDPVEQRGFFVWEDNLEYQLLKIPRPDISYFLRVPAEISKKLLDQRAAKSGVKLDEHETNPQLLKKTLKTYDLLCQLFPKDFLTIECTKNGQLLSIPEISNLIWGRIKPMLPSDKPHNGHSAVVTLDSRAQEKPGAQLKDSDDQLIQHFKNVSLHLKLQLEKQLKSIEPAGLGIWSDNSYKFYTPQGLPKNIETTYKSIMERLGQLHQQMRQTAQTYYSRQLQAGAAMPNLASLLLPATPTAALVSFSAVVPAKAVRPLCASLLASDSTELQWAAKQLYVVARQKWPQQFSVPLESNTAPEPLNQIIAKLAEDRLPFNSGDNHELKLLEALPRQEFDLLAETIYPYSSLSLDEISDEVSEWSYQQKYDSLAQAAAESDQILDKIHYKFDVITDQMTMQAVAASLARPAIQSQMPSPRNGYDVPAAVEAAGIDELYLDCFDESLKLFSLLQQADRDDLTVYATLLGHKLRWQLSLSAADLKQLASLKQGQAYDRLVTNLLEKVTESHPLTWEVLSGLPSAQPSRRGNRVKPGKRRPAKPKNHK